LNDRDFYRISMPKLKVESSTQLKDVLQTLGINNMFDSVKADLSGMTGRPDLYVDGAFQKAVIEVTEKGTTAAAATGFQIVSKSLFMSKYLNVNHPFLFVLRDQTANVNVFMGRFSDPSS
ncbi:hypothetical protein LOTGIDRAFT_167545, partial [Lottia gigantea]